MALVKTPKLKQSSNELKTVDYVEGDKENLTILSLEQLAIRYGDIDQQAQLMKGLILVEARTRFPSNIEFSHWVESVQTLCSDTPQYRTCLMNLARFYG